MDWIIILLGLAFLAFILNFTVFSNTNTGKKPLYQKKKALFSPAERSFFGVLNQAVKNKAIVFGKVRVADIIKPLKGMSKSDWIRAFNQISAKHFDYVICDPNDLSILAVVELDDKSHSNKNRSKRDIFLEKACSGANLPLHRIKASRNYSTEKIRNLIFPPTI